MLPVSVARRVVQEHLHLQGSEGVVIVTDESPGHEPVLSLAAAARARGKVIGHDWKDLIVRGPVLVAGGASLLYGGAVAAPAHFVGIVPNATVEISGRVLLDAGEYDPQLLHETDEPIGADR
jgi:hypothetical protein